MPTSDLRDLECLVDQLEGGRRQALFEIGREVLPPGLLELEEPGEADRHQSAGDQREEHPEGDPAGGDQELMLAKGPDDPARQLAEAERTERLAQPHRTICRGPLHLVHVPRRPGRKQEAPVCSAEHPEPALRGRRIDVARGVRRQHPEGVPAHADPEPLGAIGVTRPERPLVDPASEARARLIGAEPEGQPPLGALPGRALGDRGLRGVSKPP